MLQFAKMYSMSPKYNHKNYTYFLRNTLRLIPRDYIGSIRNWNYTSLSQFAKIYQHNFVYIDCINAQANTLDMLLTINKTLQFKTLKGKKIEHFIENNTINYFKNKTAKQHNGFIWYIDNIPSKFISKDSWITFLECLEEIVSYWNELGLCFRIFYREK